MLSGLLVKLYNSKSLKYCVMILLVARRRDWRVIIYKYNILERVLVENIIPRNVIINRGAAEVDNHISKDDFSNSTLSRMLYLFYYTKHNVFIF